MCRLLYISWLISVLICNYSCDKSLNPEETTKNKMFVYPNIGNDLYLVDYQTFKVARTIELDIPDSIGCFGWCLSTNRDYLVFSASTLQPPFTDYIVSYNIDNDRIHGVFPTGFDSVGAPRLASAQNPDEPGLAYLYSHSLGIYSFDFLTQEVIECISSEHNQSLDKYIIHSPDKKWTVIHKDIGGYTSEIEFYDAGSGLSDLRFVLNEDDKDSVSIYDVSFSEDSKLLYVSFQLSEGRSREIESYFGNYDLETKQLYRAPLKFPWSLNPYYMTYSSKRKEAYLVGAYDKFYIIDIRNYTLKDTVTLEGKIQGASRILLRPDEEVAFVSCSRTDYVMVINLDTRSIIDKIEVSRPYFMIIP